MSRFVALCQISPLTPNMGPARYRRLTMHQMAATCHGARSRSVLGPQRCQSSLRSHSTVTLPATLYSPVARKADFHRETNAK